MWPPSNTLTGLKWAGLAGVAAALVATGIVYHGRHGGLEADEGAWFLGAFLGTPVSWLLALHPSLAWIGNWVSYVYLSMVLNCALVAFCAGVLRAAARQKLEQRERG